MASERVHKDGPATGYETDGVNYWPAPVLVESWGRIQDQERALDAVIRATALSIAEARGRLESERRRWWDALYRDLGLDRDTVYTFNRLSGKLSPVPRAEDSLDAAGEE